MKPIILDITALILIVTLSHFFDLSVMQLVGGFILGQIFGAIELFWDRDSIEKQLDKFEE